MYMVIALSLMIFETAVNLESYGMGLFVNFVVFIFIFILTKLVQRFTSTVIFVVMILD